MSEVYGVRPWEMRDLAEHHFRAIQNDVKLKNAEAKKAARGG